MRFKDIIGNEKNVSSLKKIAVAGNVSHAYIFSGIDGIGKTLIAKTFASAIMCENYEGELCTECRNCRLTAAGSHPDVSVLDLTSDEKASIGIEDIRELKRDIYLKPFYGGRKIYILENADKMTAEAQNSLLKVFEEPPEYATIILICANIDNILPTITSRAVNMNFEPLSPDELLEFLKRNGGITEESGIYAKISGGSINNLLEFTENPEKGEFRKSVLNGFSTLLTRGANTAIDRLAVVFVQNKERKYEISGYMSCYLSDIVSFKTGGKNLIVNTDFADSIAGIASELSFGSVYKMQNEIARLNEGFKKNINYKLLVIDVLIKINDLS